MAETPCQVNSIREANWVDVGIGIASPSCVRGNHGRARGRTHSGRSQRRVAGSRAEPDKRSTSTNLEKLEPLLEWKGQPHRRGGQKHGRRSARSRQKSAKKVVGEKDNWKESLFEKSRNFARYEWNGDEIGGLQVEGAENASSLGRSEYDDENGQATGDDYSIMLDEYAVGFSGKSNDMQAGSNDYIDGDDIEDEGDNGLEDEQVDLDIKGYINEESDEKEGIGDGHGNPNGDPDEVAGSSSKEYSD